MVRNGTASSRWQIERHLCNESPPARRALAGGKVKVWHLLRLHQGGTLLLLAWQRPSLACTLLLAACRLDSSRHRFGDRLLQLGRHLRDARHLQLHGLSGGDALDLQGLARMTWSRSSLP